MQVPQHLEDVLDDHAVIAHSQVAAVDVRPFAEDHLGAQVLLGCVGITGVRKRLVRDTQCQPLVRLTAIYSNGHHAKVEWPELRQVADVAAALAVHTIVRGRLRIVEDLRVPFIGRRI